MARRCSGVFIVFLLKLMLTECEESSEETAPYEVLGDEYAQIFHNIPTLFEYILEILEERPEILEKDDVTFFQEIPQEYCGEHDKKEIKREVYEQYDDNELALSNDYVETFKRNADIKKYDNKHSTNEFTTKTPKRKPRDNQNNNEVTPIDTTKLKKHLKNKSNAGGRDKNKATKRNAKFDESFIGSMDWSKFNLSPEEVKEQALKVEEAIEKHNRKEM